MPSPPSLHTLGNNNPSECKKSLDCPTQTISPPSSASSNSSYFSPAPIEVHSLLLQDVNSNPSCLLNTSEDSNVTTSNVSATSIPSSSSSSQDQTNHPKEPSSPLQQSQMPENTQGFQKNEVLHPSQNQECLPPPKYFSENETQMTLEDNIILTSDSNVHIGLNDSIIPVVHGEQLSTKSCDPSQYSDELVLNNVYDNIGGDKVSCKSASEFQISGGKHIGRTWRTKSAQDVLSENTNDCFLQNKDVTGSSKRSIDSIGIRGSNRMCRDSSFKRSRTCSMGRVFLKSRRNNSDGADSIRISREESFRRSGDGSLTRTKDGTDGSSYEMALESDDTWHDALSHISPPVPSPLPTRRNIAHCGLSGASNRIAPDMGDLDKVWEDINSKRARLASSETLTPYCDASKCCGCKMCKEMYMSDELPKIYPLEKFHHGATLHARCSSEGAARINNAPPGEHTLLVNIDTGDVVMHLGAGRHHGTKITANIESPPKDECDKMKSPMQDGLNIPGPSTSRDGEDQKKKKITFVSIFFKISYIPTKFV